MKGKIKVKPIFGAHQIYQEIVNYPPRGVEYLGVSKQTKKGEYYQNKKWKEFLNRVSQFFNLPRITLLKPGDYDLIHTSRGIIPLNRKPWVMDVEHFYSFMGLHSKAVENKLIKKFIEWKLGSKYCKAILCHCNATLQGFLKHFDCRKFKDKLQVVYPSAHITKIKKEKHKNVRILCVLSLFEQKGGIQVLEAFSRLEKKYDNVELWMRADVPEEIKTKYNSKNIKYTSYSNNIVPREDLIKNVYSKCDVFLYPSLCDSFGFSLMDAMVSGLPIIGTNLFAIPEIVLDGKTGLIINIPGYDLHKAYIQEYPFSLLVGGENEKFIKGMELALEKLISNESLRNKLAVESFNRVNSGEFSIDHRNKKLLSVYREALNAK